MFGTVRVDQGIGMATEAQLDLPVGTDDGGSWQLMEDGFVQPFARIRVEIKVGDGGFVPLVDGPVVAQRFQLDATPERSQMTLVVHDDSVLLNRDEAVAVFEDQSPSDIAEQLFGDAGLQAAGRIPCRRPAAPSSASSCSAARRCRRCAGWRATTACSSTWSPAPPPARASASSSAAPRHRRRALPDLVLLGPSRNIGSFHAEFDALRPQAPRAANQLANDHSAVSAETSVSPGHGARRGAGTCRR